MTATVTHTDGITVGSGTDGTRLRTGTGRTRRRGGELVGEYLGDGRGVGNITVGSDIGLVAVPAGESSMTGVPAGIGFFRAGVVLPYAGA